MKHSGSIFFVRLSANIDNGVDDDDDDIYLNIVYVFILFMYQIFYIFTEAGLAQSRASVGAKAASVARNKEG